MDDGIYLALESFIKNLGTIQLQFDSLVDILLNETLWKKIPEVYVL